MNRVKESVRAAIRSFGYDLTPYKARDRGANAFLDMASLLQGVESPLIIDAGANIGQSIARFKPVFPGARIHSFEPSPSSFATLSDNCKKMSWSDVKLWNCGLGSKTGTLAFNETNESVASSFLSPGPFGPEQIERVTNSSVITLDDFASRENVDHISILKSDTQGFDYEVLKGATGLMSRGKIELVYFEFILDAQYEDLPRLDDVLGYLFDHRFRLVGFYSPQFRRGLLAWFDILAVHQDSYARWCLSNARD